jgi:hypothetical protein
MMSRSKWLLAAVAAVSLVATPAHAQTPSPKVPPPKTKTPPAPKPIKVSHWGVVFSATPSWYLPSFLVNSLASDGGSAVVVGRQFAIGVVHGNARRGDWGVTFIHQPVKDGSRISDSDSECGFSNGPLSGGCFNTSGGGISKGVAFEGVQVHKFIPFALIKRRAQIGIELAIGYAKLTGTVVKTSSDVAAVQFNQKTGLSTGLLTTTVTNEDVSAEILGSMPIGRVTVVGAWIVNPAIKVRWEGGIIFPGQSFSTIAVTYLFGAHNYN